MEIKDEWTQVEYLKALNEGTKKIILVDTILSPIEGAQTITYDPYQMQAYDEGTIFLFYCDTGKASLDRLPEYKKKFPDHICISLRGGRGYWRPYLRAEMV